jgi:hypothetical protein
VSLYVASPLIAALSPGHCDINRLHLWSPIVTGNHLDRPEIIPNVAQTTGTVDVFDPGSDISGPTARRASACTDFHELKGKENKTNFHASTLYDKMDTYRTKCLQLT